MTKNPDTFDQQSNSDKTDEECTPKENKIKKLFVNKNFIILLGVAIILGGFIYTIKQVKQNKDNIENMIPIINYLDARVFYIDCQIQGITDEQCQINYQNAIK